MPNKYENKQGVWYCDELKMSVDIFNIDPKARVHDADGTIETYRFLRDYGDNVTITNKSESTPDGAYLFGKIKYSEDYFTITADDNRKYVFVYNNIANQRLLSEDIDVDKQKLIDEFGEHFYLHEDSVIHIKNNDLISTRISDGEESAIAYNVEKFFVYDEKIIFLTKYERTEEGNVQTNKLVMTDFQFNQVSIRENVDNFYVYKDDLYVFYEYHNSFPVGEKELNIVSLKDFRTKEKIGLPYVWLTNIYPVNKREMICYMYGDFYIYNFDELDEKPKVIPWTDSDEDVLGEVEFVHKEGNVSDDKVYIHYQARAFEDGVIKNINDEDNGLWVLDLYTTEKTKISESGVNC